MGALCGLGSLASLRLRRNGGAAPTRTSFAPLQGKTLLKKGSSLDSFLRLLICATVRFARFFACGQFPLSMLYGFAERVSLAKPRPHNRPRQRTPSIPNSEFRIPNYSAPQIMICRTVPHKKAIVPLPFIRDTMACYYSCLHSVFVLVCLQRELHGIARAIVVKMPYREHITVYRVAESRGILPP